eukprot:6267547-Amphidinium_carterae.1
MATFIALHECHAKKRCCPGCATWVALYVTGLHEQQDVHRQRRPASSYFTHMVLMFVNSWQQQQQQQQQQQAQGAASNTMSQTLPDDTQTKAVL